MSEGHARLQVFILLRSMFFNVKRVSFEIWYFWMSWNQRTFAAINHTILIGF